MSIVPRFMRCPKCGKPKITPWSARRHWRKTHMVATGNSSPGLYR